MSERLRRTPNCLDAETLAALIDGRLEPISRERTQAHLNECADCHEAFVESARLDRELDEHHGQQTSGSLWKRRGVWYGALGAVAAAVVAAVIVRPLSSSPERELDSAIQQLAVAAAKDRLTEGRLSGPFDWAPIPAEMRSPGRVSRQPDVEVQARRLQLLAPTLPIALRSRAMGMALLAQGDLDGAIEQLNIAVTVSDADPRALVDLSAALLERWRQRSDRSDAQNAKNRAEAALAQNPANAEAAFNVALAAEALGLKDEAIKAWVRCASLYPTSKWAAEARARALALTLQKN